MKKKIGVFTLVFALAACIGGYFSRSKPYTNEEGWKRAFLASYPRSGNHWVRYLVEEATNKVTGSVCPDEAENGNPPHSKEAYSWGGHALPRGYEDTRELPSLEDTVLLKTHYPIMKARAYDTEENEIVIRLVRNPLDAIYSHSQYKYRYQKEKLPLSQKKWKAFIRKHAIEWRDFLAYWDTRENVFTYRYEDLMENPQDMLRDILNHLGYSVSESDIARAVKKYPPSGGVNKHAKHYKEDDLDFIRKHLAKELERYQYN